jgi:hypothetical protein
MRGNGPQDLEAEVEYGRLHGNDPGGPPSPRRGDRYVVLGLIAGVVTGAAVGALFGRLISYFIAMIAGAFVGGFLGVQVGSILGWRSSKCGGQ